MISDHTFSFVLFMSALALGTLHVSLGIIALLVNIGYVLYKWVKLARKNS